MMFVANFKAYKNDSDVNLWLNSFHALQENSGINKKADIIIAPQYTAISYVSEFIKHNKWSFAIHLASQDVSQYEIGSYTGEVTSSVIKAYCQYTIVGHSERRKYFLENNQIVNNKIELLLENSIRPIVCISSIEEFKSIDEENLDKIILAYEPISAIGSGVPMDPQTAMDFKRKLLKIKNSITVLYGGSVNQDNVRDYVGKDRFNGVLVGKASLDPKTFITIIKNCE